MIVIKKALLLALAVLPTQVYSQICENNRTYLYQNNPDQHCRWIRNNESRRKELCLVPEVSENCKQSCGFCCDDDPDYTFGSYAANDGGYTIRNCDWIDKNKKKTETRRGEWCEKYKANFVVKDKCPNACDYCFSTVAPTSSPTGTSPPSSSSVAPTIPVTSPPTPASTASDAPSANPSRPPSPMPSPFPTTRPSSMPSISPTENPSLYPSDLPSDLPSKEPSEQPSKLPSMEPSEQPSKEPSDLPSELPSKEPSELPSKIPSMEPTGSPTWSIKPSPSPSAKPSIISAAPSDIASLTPSATKITNAPSAAPTCPSSCQGDVTTEKFFIAKINKKKNCNWAIRNSGAKAGRCANPEVQTNCCESCCLPCFKDAVEPGVKFDVEGEISPRTCEWAVRKESSKNTRCNLPEVKLNCCKTCEAHIN